MGLGLFAFQQAVEVVSKRCLLLKSRCITDIEMVQILWKVQKIVTFSDTQTRGPLSLADACVFVARGRYNISTSRFTLVKKVLSAQKTDGVLPKRQICGITNNWKNIQKKQNGQPVTMLKDPLAAQHQPRLCLQSLFPTTNFSSLQDLSIYCMSHFFEYSVISVF